MIGDAIEAMLLLAFGRPKVAVFKVREPIDPQTLKELREAFRDPRNARFVNVPPGYGMLRVVVPC